MSAADVLREAVAKVLREHGTAHLLPDDEFDCCVEEVVNLFEHKGWYQPSRQLGEQLWACPQWEPQEQWEKPVLPFFALVGRASEPTEGD